jgi:hypothetical protein
MEGFEWVHAHPPTTRAARHVSPGKGLSIGLGDDEAIMLKDGGRDIICLVGLLVDAFVIPGNAVAREG